jgi:PAS domain S-box-containing protein
VQCVGFDITQQKRSEADLRASEQRYRQMFEMHRLPKLIIDPENGRIVDANPAAATFYGYTVQTLKTLTIFDVNLSPPAEVQSKMAKATTSTIVTCEFVHRGAGGQPRNVEVFTGPVENAGRQLLYSIITDTTEKQRAKVALQEAHDLLEQRVAQRTAELEKANNRLAAIFDHSGDAIVLLDIEQGIQQANRAFDSTWAVAADHYIGTQLSAFIQSDGNLNLDAVIAEVARTHRTYQFEAQAIRRDGSTFDVEMSIAPVNRSTEAVSNLVCIIRDITERKKAELAIAEERNLLRTVIDAVPAFIYVKDTDHRMILNNVAHARSLGFDTPLAAVGSTDNDLFPPAMVAKFHDDEARIFRTDCTILASEERTLDQDGQEIWGLTTKVPLRNTKNELIGLVGITHDISRLKATEEALRYHEQQLHESQKMLQLVLDTIPVAVFWKDRESVYLGCNRRFAEDAGLTHTIEIIGKSDKQLPWLASEAAAFRADDCAVMESGAPKLAYEETIFTVTGNQRYIQTNKLPLRNEESQVIGVLGAYIDITERKQAEETLKLALAQEKELGELKSRFVSMASHEFRTPLTAILATTDTLSHYRHKMDAAQVDQRLTKIRQQVIHMKDIIDDVLQLARAGAGRLNFNPVHADLDQLCQEIVEEFCSQYPHHERINYSCAAPVLAEFDSRLMRQVISNLISNALKYSPAEAAIDVELAQTPDTITLIVRDQGIGIPARDLKHLFEPFHRATNVGAISGTGLGLSIARQAIELHGGTITPASQVGVGTTFLVTLPKISSVPFSQSR